MDSAALLLVETIRSMKAMLHACGSMTQLHRSCVAVWTFLALKLPNVCELSQIDAVGPAVSDETAGPTRFDL